MSHSWRSSDHWGGQDDRSCGSGGSASSCDQPDRSGGRGTGWDDSSSGYYDRSCGQDTWWQGHDWWHDWSQDPWTSGSWWGKADWSSAERSFPAVAAVQAAVAALAPSTERPTRPPPVFPAIPESTAVAESTSLVRVLGLDYFLAFERPFTHGYKQHNAALKFFQDSQEVAHDPFNSPPLHFEPSGYAAVAVIDHDAKGMGWAWKDETRLWSWQEMIAQLTPESMEVVVKGPEGRSCGVVGCSFAVRPNSYDHGRSHMIKEKTGKAPNVKLPIWDFVVHRADGTAIRLHPEWSKPRFPSFASEGHESAVQPPLAGLGGSDGPGTYCQYKLLAKQETLCFTTGR